MELWPAFILGFVGSLHCAGMCGPLALALPATGATRTSFVVGRVAYNFGRLITYCALGAVVGLIGMTFALAGLQRWVSLVAGLIILIAFAISSRFALNTPVAKAVAWLKSGLASLLRRRTLNSLILLGALNGLLPCGLVYVACAGAVATGGFSSSVEYMLLFGLGTVPMMLGIGLLGKQFQFAIRFKLQKLIPVCVVALGVLLVLRGLALGIPYLSPNLSNARAAGAACH